MESFSLSNPQKPRDWIELKNIYREKLHFLLRWSPDKLALSYAVSYLEPYDDPSYRAAVEDLVNQSDDPLRRRFVMAVEICSHFWEDYFSWCWEMVPQGEKPSRHYYTIIEESGLRVIWQRMAAGSPNYPGDVPEELLQKVLTWLTEGYRAYPNDEQMKFDLAHIGMRTANGNSLLKAEHLHVIEELTGEKYFPTTNALRGPGDFMIEQVNEIEDELANGSDETG
jgi:hypothetical protein